MPTKLTLVLLCSAGLCLGLEQSFTGTVFPPLGWVTVNADSGVREWQRLDIGYRTRPGCAYCGWEDSHLRNADWLITPRCSVVQGDSFGFWCRAQSPDYRESLEVWISTKGPRLPEFEPLDRFGTDSVGYQHRQYDLSAYAGRRVFLAAVYRSLARYGAMIDDVSGPAEWTPTHDVGIDRVLAPRSMRIGKSATLACWARNQGIAAEDFRVSYEIPGVWREETTVTLGAKESLLVAFPEYRFAQPGTLEVVFSTHLGSDQQPWNDTVRFDLAVHPYASRGGPDSTGYVWYDSDDPLGPEYDWLELCPGGTLLGSGDDTLFLLVLDWPVPYYGAQYPLLFVSTNGWLAFGPPTPGTAESTNVRIPDRLRPNRLVALFWDNLWVKGNEGGIWYRYFGDSLLVVEWRNTRRKGCDACSLNFQVKLLRSGVIELHYKDVDARDAKYDRGMSATVGIENAAGTHGLEYLHDGVPPANLLEPGRALRFVPPAPGVADRQKPDVLGPATEPTIVGDVLVWSAATPSLRNARDIALQSRAMLLDASGRVVMDLQPGENDIRHLAPGVYFVVTPSPLPSPPEGERMKERGVRSAVSGTRSAVRKVVIQR